MDYSSRCLFHIEQLNDTEQWGLSPAARREMAQAIVPWITAAGPLDETDFPKIVKNYYWDGAIVEALQRADVSAPDVVSQWRAFMLAVVRSRLQVSLDLAEDIVQDSWIDLLQALRNYRFHFRSRFKTFLYSVVIHRSLNTLRREHHQDDPPLPDGERLHPVDNPGQQDWVNGELFTLVDNAIQRYCTARRQGGIAVAVKKQLAQLVLLEGQPIQEAAARLGVNYNAAMTIVRRIRQHLQQIPELREYDG